MAASTKASDQKRGEERPANFIEEILSLRSAQRGKMLTGNQMPISILANTGNPGIDVLIHEMEVEVFSERKTRPIPEHNQSSVFSSTSPS
jgi:hypothetical protein